MQINAHSLSLCVCAVSTGSVKWKEDLNYDFGLGMKHRQCMYVIHWLGRLHRKKLCPKA